MYKTKQIGNKRQIHISGEQQTFLYHQESETDLSRSPFKSLVKFCFLTVNETQKDSNNESILLSSAFPLYEPLAHMFLHHHQHKHSEHRPAPILYFRFQLFLISITLNDLVVEICICCQ